MSLCVYSAAYTIPYSITYYNSLCVYSAAYTIPYSITYYNLIVIWTESGKHRILATGTFQQSFRTGLVLIRKCATRSSVEMNENYIMKSQWSWLWRHSLHVYQNILMLWLGITLVMFVNNAIILCYLPWLMWGSQKRERSITYYGYIHNQYFQIISLLVSCSSFTVINILCIKLFFLLISSQLLNKSSF